ncbi:MAG: hypothetical protein LAO09_04675 [Acidobacteriia bacterium]|nr:hypothetical protein [Terriglobia bacterium]
MMLNCSVYRLAVLGLLAVVLLSIAPAVAAQVAPKPSPGTPQDVLTYHGDNFRTGWFPSEKC